MEKYQLETKDFDYFVECSKKWGELLGLIDWSLDYIFSNEDQMDELEGNMAVVCMDRNGAIATVHVNACWKGTKPTKENLNSCALHEMLEVLLNPLLVLAGTRFHVDDADLDYEKHRVIRVFENLLPKMRDVDERR